VVDVPIGDEHLANPVALLGVASGDGDIVYHAETHAVPGAGVVSRRTDHAKTALRFAGADFIHCGESAADSTHRGSPGMFADVCVAGGKLGETAVNLILGKAQIRTGMDELQVCACSVSGFDPLHLRGDPGSGERVDDGIESARLLGVPVAGIMGLT
jgi:hypothetical protein